MNESFVQPVSSVRASDNNVPAKVMAPDRLDNFTSREHGLIDVDRTTKQAEVEKAQEKHLANISIHFNVDEETNRLVVIVSERETGRIIRTIPASEFEKLQAGDLLKLTA